MPRPHALVPQSYYYRNIGLEAFDLVLDLLGYLRLIRQIIAVKKFEGFLDRVFIGRNVLLDLFGLQAYEGGRVPLRRGREPLVSGIPELEVGLELLFYVAQLLVVLRGNDTASRWHRVALTPSTRS